MLLYRNAVEHQVGSGSGITVFGLVNASLSGNYVYRSNGEPVGLATPWQLAIG
jgi:hypothetical protein